MPDALQMLRQDHDDVKEIFKQFSGTDDSKMRKQLAQQAMMKLEVHSNLEEEFFYPAVRSEGDTDQLMNEAAEEHHLADLLMDELRGMSPEDERYEAKFEVLAESVRHHIDEEESEVFPKAAELGQDRLREIGEQMEQRKPALMQQAEMPKRRRPSAGTSRGRAAPRRTTRAGGTRSTSGRTTRASGTRSTSGRTTRASGTRSTSGRTTRASGTRGTSNRTTRASAGTKRTSSGRSEGRTSARRNGGRTASRTTRGSSARSGSSRTTRSAGTAARSSRTRSGSSSGRAATRTSGTSRGRSSTDSRRRTASRSSSSRTRTSRR